MLFTKYAWIEQESHSEKEIPNHGHSISGVDWGSQHSCGEISHANSTKRHIKSNQHMDTSHAFSNYIKTTLNHGLSLSEDDWVGNIGPNHTSNECSLMEVDCRGKSPNHTSSRCMLMEVDWGKVRVSHISECMLSEVNWRAHETHLNGHSITEVDWGGHDRSL